MFVLTCFLAGYVRLGLVSWNRIRQQEPIRNLQAKGFLLAALKSCTTPSDRGMSGLHSLECLRTGHVVAGGAIWRTSKDAVQMQGFGALYVAGNWCSSSLKSRVYVSLNLGICESSRSARRSCI
jgi:hypothetical protein